VVWHSAVPENGKKLCRFALIDMSDIVIDVENLSKRYLVGHRSAERERYPTLRDVIGREARNFARKAADFVRGRQIVQGDEIEEFWALRDISFKLKCGEVLGIVGRNGAGKSTLLKILSRITEPDAGRATLRGRVSSLLEVGTGFHPELTGRENIYLNGAILGMSRMEIKRKFDEIVDFAELEKFLDTPVKRYSSGMYVRLAFAVAAHLEPEILIVDEVLAVGDAEFQKKCLGKMDDVSRNQGRTVLFVSHNMEAVLKLCNRAILLDSGSIREMGDVKSVVAAYLQNKSPSPSVVDLSTKVRDRPFTGKVRFVKAAPSDAADSWSIPFGQPLSVDLSINAQPTVTHVEVFVDIYTVGDFELVSWSSNCSKMRLPVRAGLNTFRIIFQHLPLLPGRYYLGMALHIDRGVEDSIREAVHFDVNPSLQSAEINADIFGGALTASALISRLERADAKTDTQAERSENKFDPPRSALGPHRVTHSL
jgi:lipopolysaccharide transport system ATP-binding protein